MTNITKALTAKRGKRRLMTGRRLPRWKSTGMRYMLPETLDSTKSEPVPLDSYYSCISVLLHLRNYLSGADPLLVALHIDDILLYRETIGGMVLKEHGDYFRRKRSHYRTLTPAEKRFVTERNT